MERLAGFELEPQITSRPLAMVGLVHDDGEVELREDLEGDLDVAPMPAVRDAIILSRATRLRRLGRDLGRAPRRAAGRHARRLNPVGS